MPEDFPPLPPKRSKLQFAAAAVGFLIAAASLWWGLRHLVALLPATIAIIAAVGILRRRVWAAYGFALIELTQALLLLALWPQEKNAQFVPAALFSLASSLLFFFAGRSLARSGAQRGLVFPWIATACLLTLPFIFVRAYAMPTGSMEDTLLIGDHFLVRVFPHVTTLGRGEIVAFHYPIDRNQIFVKRAIALPGDRIHIASNIVYVNGTLLNEPYVTHKRPQPDAFRDNLPHDIAEVERVPLSPEGIAAAKDMLLNHVVNGEVVVPPDKYFVLGDNRDNSLDSRYWGFIDVSEIVGKPILIYASEEAKADATPLSAPQIRWNRLFRLL